MSNQEQAFLRKLQNTLWSAFGGLLLVVILAAVPFYFNTQSEIRNNKERILELKAGKADKEIYELTVQQIKEELQKINKKLP